MLFTACVTMLRSSVKKKPNSFDVPAAANKGIGWDIARILAEKGLRTIVAARNEELGQEATAKLQKATGRLPWHNTTASLDLSDEVDTVWSRSRLAPSAFVAQGEIKYFCCATPAIAVNHNRKCLVQRLHSFCISSVALRQSWTLSLGVIVRRILALRLNP